MMRKQLTRRAVCLAIMLASVWAATAVGQAPVRVLILSGANVHEWQKTTPLLRDLFDKHPRFRVARVLDDVTRLDGALMDACDVVVSNFTKHPQMAGRFWGEAAEQAFIGGVRAGKGFVAIHAACSADQDWPEIQQLYGLTWKLNETGHTQIHTYKVEFAGVAHPITRGLPTFWMTDELYQKMWKETPSEFQVLASAFAWPQWGGTGRYEPVLLTTSLGKGRGVNLLLGHDVTAMSNAGFQALLLRSAEWAASGNVTLPVPQQWPNTFAAAVSAGVDPTTAVREAATYRFGQSRQPLFVLEQLVIATTALGPEAPQRAALASQLAASLASDAAPEAKSALCEQLGNIAGPRQVNAIAALLEDEKTTQAARQALVRIPDEAAAAALRQSLANTGGGVRVGIIHSIGDRGDRAAVAALAKLLGDPDSTTTTAAALALGRIGGLDAARALQSALNDASAGARPAVVEALLLAADSLLAEKHVGQATEIHRRLYLPAESTATRMAALRGLVAADRAGAERLLDEAMKSSDRGVRSAAMQIRREASASSEKQ